MGHPVVHFEVSARDADAQREFYASVFDWQVTVHDETNYTMFDTGNGEGVNGGLFKNEQGGAYVTFYVGVDDLQAQLDKANAAGATTVLGPTDIPGAGSMALFADPEGNVIGLYKAGD